MKPIWILCILFSVNFVRSDGDFAFPDEDGGSIETRFGGRKSPPLGIKTRHHSSYSHGPVQVSYQSPVSVSYSKPSGSYGYGGGGSIPLAPQTFSFSSGHPTGSFSYSKGGSSVEIPVSQWSGQSSSVNDFLSNFGGKQKFVFEGGDIKEDTLAFLDNARFQLPALGSCREPFKLPLNVQYKCQDGINTCKLTCKNNYYFPEGLSSLNIVCMNGKWIIEGVEWSELPSCTPVCNPPCQNNGICFEPGLCKCPENYYGPLCQHKNVVCASKPPVPKNSKVSCKNTNCNVECIKGYKFPDGSGITNMGCVDGQWQHTKTGQSVVPDCEPICDPPCQNSGTCVGFNVCQCSQNYKGSRCEYDYKTCNITKTGFKGNFRCSYESEQAKCIINCPETIQFDSVPAAEYTCKYSEGVFKPTPMPKCVYPAGYRVISSGYSSSLHYKPGSEYSTSWSGSSLSKSAGTDETLEFIMKWRQRASRMNTNEFSFSSSSSEEFYDNPGTYSLYVTHDIDGVLSKTPKSALCATWGGVNVKTFDGIMYKSPLSCSHTLVSDRIDGTFDVILKACPYGSGFDCPHVIKIFWQSIIYSIESVDGTYKFSTPKKSLPIPVQVMGIKVVPVAEHLQIDLDSVGLSMLWDGKHLISVQATAALWNRTGGICGTLDANSNNEFMSKDGVVLKTPKSFTDSWRLRNYDDSPLCKMDRSEEATFDQKCSGTQREKAKKVCTTLLSNPKLTNCIEPFNIIQLLQSCMQDYCTCPNKDNPTSCNCNSMAMLAKECVFRGEKLEHGWRNLEICPINCKNGRIYLPCGPAVEPTCGSVKLPNKEVCNEGCFCPEGTVQHKDKCISPELCPCTLRNKEFKAGSKIQRDCNTCVCENGVWDCTDETCGSRCGAVGDPHYCTFDGKKFDFMGKCSYYLMKTNNLSVEAENVPCPGSISETMDYETSVSLESPSCTKSVTINTVISGKDVKIKLGQGLVVHVNGKEVTKFPKVFGNGKMLIRQASSTMVTVDFDDGFRVWWDGMTKVYIDAPSSYRGKTKGLCGNFNSNTNDDLLTPEGDVETSVEAFADKWRTKDTCDLVNDLSKEGIHPCTSNPEAKEKAEKYCNHLLDEVFEECHWSVEPEPYMENCMYDVCACKDDPHKCFCPIMSAYGTECNRQGIKTNWRYAIEECVVKCPSGQIFDECGNSCVRTCSDIANQDFCEGHCVEGCRCPKGEYLDENNQCIPAKECPCTFEGMVFKTGYKETRPGRKFLELCECSGGSWECTEAQPGDDIKYPPAEEMKNKCTSKPFAEFSKCAPVEPMTCKNMHEYTEDLDDCAPGCVCKVGYVYDITLEECVPPSNCSCHHGGKSFLDGEKIQEDCNVCTCKSGNWKCTENECESTCSVWGDSHFTTFDNHDFDFQGACDYILSKGESLNGDGFAISIQNVLCGTMGVTCSKSVEITLTGSYKDTILLTADHGYVDENTKTVFEKLREKAKDKPYHVYKVGLFIVIEVPYLGLQLKWDEGTRVYVKLTSQWKNKVNGLCGNYNGNTKDDMKTPSQGLETSPLVFGHSWKIQDYCSAPVEQIDACKEHPERETWAQLKCGVLKSSVFSSCHSEVPIEKYLKRCIFDTCACDQGGDCECLCTAISAYAHACSIKGVHIKWRNQHLCPMQCDPHCSEYKSCTSACPVETCENFLDQGVKDRMCMKENCFEGCQIKPCEEGFIYTNSSFSECVPKSKCKPICLERDGKIYYEGDIIKSDECQTCRCSKKKEVCSGVPCFEKIIETTVKPYVTQPPPNTQEEKKCVKGWTKWQNHDDDVRKDKMKKNDLEPLPTFDKLELVYATCDKEFIKKIECRVARSRQPYETFDEKVDCSVENGLKCIGKCHDYEIRVYCSCDDEDIEQPPTVKPPPIAEHEKCDVTVAEYAEYPGDCYKFLHCQPQTDGSWAYVEKTCGPTMMFNPIYNVCDHIFNVKLLKPDCGDEVKPLEPKTKCPPGKVWSECANHCEHSCDYYLKTLRKRGLCKPGEKCKGGCVEDNNAVDCPSKMKYWRDKHTCVDDDECPCMSADEEYVKPHSVYDEKLFGECKTCQCLDNTYICKDCVEKGPPPAKYTETTTTLHSLISTTEKPLVVPTTVTPPTKCDPNKLIPMINGEKPLSDEAFSASSFSDPSHQPKYGRLHNKDGAWSPKINDQMQYLQIDLGHPTPLFGVVMEGSPMFEKYVTLFKILFSYDGEAFHYLVDETESPQLFKGPIDSRTPLQTLFKIPVEAKVIRIYPLKWHTSIAMRVELLGCNENDRLVTTTTPAYNEKYENKPICTEPLGVENGQLYPKQVSVSSNGIDVTGNQKPKLIDLLKLSSPIGWKPSLNSPNEFIKFDFLEPRNLTGLTTKGGPHGWVTGYKVMYSKNGKIWNNLINFLGEPVTLIGNHDNDSPQTNYFKYALQSRYLKIVPLKWEDNINMRVEPLGCFEEYPVVVEDNKIVDKPKPKPSVECAMCNDVESNELLECDCLAPLYWNGTKCVEKNKCPCVENHVSYPIGSKYENKDCEECVCVLGGVAQCKPKKCPPCPSNQRHVITNSCYCKCESCPEMQKLCPSSGDCIPEAFWCNGIKDCEDDEPAECTKILKPDNKPEREQNTTIIKHCPEPKCPPGMKMRITEKAATRQLSQIFKSSFEKKVTTVRNGSRLIRTKTINKVEEFLPMAELEEGFDEVEECAEFVCAPEPITQEIRNESFKCALPRCPDDYEVEVDNSAFKPGECIKYTCVLRPQKDDVCLINGKSFTTFDGTEFKYETCSHILARDLLDSSWTVTLRQNCTKDKVCKKEVTIKDKDADAVLTILPDMKLSFNGFIYTVRQLQKAPLAKESFIISQPGTTMLIVAKNHGFWVSYDENNHEIKVGVSAKFKKTVDGLCGYYNGNPKDDKRMPNGQLTDSTPIFGDSWYDKSVPKEECYQQVCPRAIQAKALQLCNSIKHPNFLACDKAVNYKQFGTKCIETTCECLQRNGGDEKSCKCNILQGFVKQCLAAKPNVKLDTWRAIHNCEITCPSPLVHSDCFKRRCEPSCDNINGDGCPVLPDACFTGCYCPEGTVRKGDDCVPVTECKDCVCDSYGKSKYFTYDRQNFTFNGNCTYLLSRDIKLPGVHTFQVYVTMDDCKNLGVGGSAQGTSSCAKTLHVLQDEHIIHIERLGDKFTTIRIDGMETKKLPLKKDWIELTEKGGKELNLILPKSLVEVTSSFDDMAFSIKVPSVKYGSKMEGLCGNCDGLPENDLKVNPKKRKPGKSGKSPTIKEVVDSWQADEPKLGVPKDDCICHEEAIKNCTILDPSIDPCMKLFDVERFGKCHLLIDPVIYLSSCQQELCKPGSNQLGACQSLAAYARECKRKGVCLDWRDGFCPYDCPIGRQYRACDCDKTCEGLSTLKPNSKCEEFSEGCFCPEGKFLRGTECVPERLCKECDDGEHYPGDEWTKDACTKCSCDKEGNTQCVKKECSLQENICSEGFIPSRIDLEGECCPKYICLPEPKKPTPITCPDAPLPECGPGQYKKQKIGTDGCPQFICECKPLSECEPLGKSSKDLKPGEKLLIDKSGCCPLEKVVCEKKSCPPIPETCEQKFYELITSQIPNECCPTYKCAPPKDACIVEINGKMVLKRLGEKWIEEKSPCIENLCSYGPGNTMIVTEKHETCDVSCPIGFEYKKDKSGKCCGKCVQTKCVINDKVYSPGEKWSSSDNCTNYSCAYNDNNGQIVITSSQETCPDISTCPFEYQVKKGCCTVCKMVTESLKTCLPSSMSEGQTVGLVQMYKTGHGLCSNKDPIRGFTECHGTCQSGSKYNPLSYGQDKVCLCCSIQGYTAINVPLECKDGFKVTKEIQVPSSCGCESCESSNAIESFDVRSDISNISKKQGIKG